jgi:hypothetical protein
VQRGTTNRLLETIAQFQVAEPAIDGRRRTHLRIRIVERHLRRRAARVVDRSLVRADVD